MRPGRSDLERAARTLLAAEIREIGNGAVLERALVDRPKRGSVDVPAEILDGLGEMTNGDRLDSGERCLRCRLGSTHETT